MGTNKVKDLFIKVFIIITLVLFPVLGQAHGTVLAQTLAQTPSSTPTPTPDGVSPSQPGSKADPLPFSDGKFTTASHPLTGKVTFLSASRENPISNTNNPSGKEKMSVQSVSGPEDAARAFLESHGDVFGLTDQAEELSMRSLEAGIGSNFVKFQQKYHGIPVMGGELVTQTDDQGNVITVNGEILPGLTIDITPVITSDEAIQSALREVVGQNNGVNNPVVTTPELWIYSPELLSGTAGDPSLVWKMGITDDQLLNELVLVDALHGDVVLHFEQTGAAFAYKVYDAAGSTTYTMSTSLCPYNGDDYSPALTNPTDCGSDANSDERKAATYSKNTSTFFYDYLDAWNGVDGNGADFTSVVRYNKALGGSNSYWTGNRAVFEGGMAQADDVVAHEFTHGFIDHTAGLFNYYQSGAIAESIADVFGEFMDQTNGNGTDTDAVKWQFGEDSSRGTFRSFNNPPDFGQPDHMTSSLYSTSAADNGGIHINSGINNKAAYLLVDGGTFYNGTSTITVTGIGLAKTARIYTQAVERYLTSGSDYLDLYNALYQACTDLNGIQVKDGSHILQADCQSVRKATDAVQMNMAPTGASPAPVFQAAPTYCPTGSMPVEIFNDDLESGDSNWTLGAISGTNAWSYKNTVVGKNAHTGDGFLYADDSYPSSESYAQISALIPNRYDISDGTYLYFYHSFDLQSGIDGGIVDYNDGGSWTPVPIGWMINGYNSTSSAMSNVAAYSGTSQGYVGTRVNLSTLTGENAKSIQLRWRLKTDANTYSKGWWMDDVKVYGCVHRQGLVDDLNTGLAYTGSWSTITSSSDYNGGHHITSDSSAKVDYRFKGDKIIIYYTAGTGKADVYIDGVLNTTFDQTGAIPKTGLTIDLSNAVHRVSIRYNSTNTAGKTITLDGIYVDCPLDPGFYEDTDPGVLYTGTWTARTETGDSSGNRHDTNVGGSTATIRFHGRRITLLYASYPGYRGNGDIYIDGVKKTTLNEYALFLLYQTPWSSDYLTLGDHTLKVVFQTGQDADKYFHIDAFVISDANPPDPVGTGTYDDMDSVIDYLGSWAYFPQATGHYNNTRHETAVNDAVVRFRFTGEIVTLVYSGYPTRGYGDIYIDDMNTPVARLNQYSPTWVVNQQWVSPVLSSGDHVLEYRYANGQPVGANIVLDAFIVSNLTFLQPGMYDDTDSGILYTGSWTARTGTGDRGGTRHDTNVGGSTAIIPFYGTHVTLLYASYPGYRGNADMYIDGVKVTTLNEYALFLLYQTPWTSDYLTLGNHTLKVVFQTGQASDKYFHIDAVKVWSSTPLAAVPAGSYDDMYDKNDPLNNPYIDYIGSWAYFPEATGHYNSTRHETAVNDAVVRFKFHGTKVTLVYSGYPTRGKGDIYIDGTQVKVLDQVTSVWTVGLTWTSATLANADHTLEFRYENGQPVGANIVLDEFIVQ
jgi:bacillolysin